MYGTVAKIRMKPSAEAELERMSREQVANIPGLEFEHVFVSDNDPQEAWLVVGFTDKAAYKANAESPEQHQRYLEYVELFDGEPEWHDGEIAFSLPA